MRRTMPPTSSLACFESTVRLGSVTLAAEELNMTQSAVSKRLASLEDLLNRRLFTRQQRQLVPTPAAQEYANEIGDIINRLEVSTARLMSSGRRGGILTVAILPTFGSRWLIPRLNEFLSDNPNIEISLISKISPFDFSQDAADLAIHFGLPNWDKAQCEYLMGEDVVAVCAPSLLPPSEIELNVAQLKAHTLIQHSTRPNLWTQWFGACTNETIQASAGPRFEYYSHVIEAALAGIGVAVLPEFLIQSELEAGERKLAHPGRLTCEESYYAVYPLKNAESQNVLDFVSWLKNKCTEYSRNPFVATL